MYIKIQILGTPQVFVDDRRIFFPYKKSEALFYYLAIEKSVSRDNAALLLWEDYDEMTAKKNLRHALYIIKKEIGAEVIISPQKYLLSLNKDLNITVDLDGFSVDDTDELTGISLLEGFGVKNAYNYEEWMNVRRENFQTHFLSILYQKISSFSLSNLDEIEKYSSAYLEYDPLDERIYLIMMKAYYDNHLWYKGIKVYQKISQITNDELGISPSQECADLYHRLLDEWSKSAADEPDNLLLNSDYTAHEDYRAHLAEIYQQFLNGNSTNVILIGENGTGKTYLINSFLNSLNKENLFILRTSCFQAERSIPLQPWNNLIMEIDTYISNHGLKFPTSFIKSVAQFFPTFGEIDSDLSDVSADALFSPNYRACKNSIIRILQQISLQNKLIIAIDDIHAMDKVSIDLTGGIMRLRSPNIMFLFTAVDTPDYDTVTFISTMVKEKLLVQIPFSKLTYQETAAYVQSCLPNFPMSQDTLNQIYEKTEGVFFYINEIIRNIRMNNDLSLLSLTAQGILNDRLNGISRGARSLLDTISIFHDGALLPVLASIHGKKPLEMLDMTEELKAHALIAEVREKNDIYFSFTHHRMREFIYNKLSPSKCRILHNKTGEALETLYFKEKKGDIRDILTHFTLGENQPKCLYYKIISIEKYFSQNYELYPVLDSTIDDSFTPQGKKLQFLTEVEKSLIFYRSRMNSEMYAESEARLSYSKVQYCILSGHYDAGITTIHRMLNSQYVKNHLELRLKFMRQMVYYGNQICDLDVIDQYTKDGLQLSAAMSYEQEHALFHRLRGNYYIMTGEYKLAAASLFKSIDYLEQSDADRQSYTLNIAAAYNYLGDMHRRQGKFPSAITYYNKAISLCRENGCPQNATFFTNLGIAYFDSGDMEKCREAIAQAIYLYSNSNVLVGKTITRIFQAYFNTLDGDTKSAAEYIRKSDKSAAQIGSPSEKGCADIIKSMIASKCPSLVKRTPNEYMQEADTLLKGYCGIYLLIQNDHIT